MAKPKNIIPTKKKKAKTPSAKDKLIATKSDLIGFKGGLPVDLDRKIDGVVLREKLRLEIDTILTQELKNQEKYIEKIAKWNRLYKGIRKKREPGQANVATPIPRILTEAIVVRVFEGLENQPKLWLAKAVRNEGDTPKDTEFWEDVAKKLEDDMDWWKTDIDLRKRLFDPITQSVKIGKGIIMLWPRSKKRTVVRYATDKEVLNKKVPTFKLANGQPGIKIVETVSQQPEVFQISREDWVQSSDSPKLQDALLCGYRTYLRKPDVQLRVTQGLYDSLEAEKLISGDKIDETKIDRAEGENKEIPDYVRDKFAIWHLHYKSDVDGDGEEDDIIVFFHPETKAMLRCIYNPIFAGFRPFIDFIYNPAEYTADGEGTCEILEKLVEEIDTLHNQRIDRISQINGPITIIRKNVDGLEGFTIRPRGIYYVDDDPDKCLYEFKFADTTVSNMQEEQHLIDLCMKAVGVTPDVLGQPTADRPVFREMASRQAEANKKFRFINRRYREKIEELGMMYLEMSAQYQPTHTYLVKNGQMEEQRTITYPMEYLRDRIKVKLSGASELDNQETRREKAQQRYAVIQEYYTNFAGMIQAVVSPQTPEQFKTFLIKVSKIFEGLMEKVLQDMDMLNPEDAVMSIDDAVNVPQALQTSGKPIPGEPGEPEEPGQGGSQGQQGPPQGPPPMGMM